MVAISNAYSAYKDGFYQVSDTQGDPGSEGDASDFGGVTLGMMYGQNTAHSTQNNASLTPVGSTVSAKNIVLAVGDPNNHNATALTVMGSNLTATDTFYAKVLGNANIGASADANLTHASSGSSGFDAGVQVSYANGDLVVSVKADGNSTQSKASEAQQNYIYSHVGGGNLTVLDISGDLNMPGGIVTGNTIDANIGGNLTISSLQDTDTYASNSQSIAAGGSIGWSITTWSPRASAYVSASASDAHSTYQSVGAEQAGIQAGDGGFNVTVGGQTTLIGAIISSSQKAVDDNLNYFSTGSLAVTDLENAASYSADSTSITMGVSYGGQGRASGAAALCRAGYPLRSRTRGTPRVPRIPASRPGPSSWAANGSRLTPTDSMS